MRNFVVIIVMFLFGSSVILGVSTQTGQDSWISLLLSVVFVIPVILIYSRILKLFPEKDIYDIATDLFGTVIGKVIVLLITWYAIHLAALVLYKYCEFIVITSMPEASPVPIMLGMLGIAILLASSGIETLGKWVIPAFIAILSTVFLVAFMSLPHAEFENFFPIMNHSFGQIAGSAYKSVTFPLAEIVLFLTFASSLKKEDSPYKTFFCGILIGSLVLLVIVLRNIAVLGPELMKSEVFSSYATARLAGLGRILERVEGMVFYNVILAGIVKIAVCILAAGKGVAKLFGLENYKRIILPTSLLILALYTITSTSTSELLDFLDVYKVYVIPFQFLIPLVLWIAAEIKIKMRKKSKDVQAQPNQPDNA